MAIRTATRVTAAYSRQQVPFAGYQTEIWRLPAGDAGDEATITPSAGRFVVAVLGGSFSHNLSSAGTDASVTLTYRATYAAGSMDVILLVQP